MSMQVRPADRVVVLLAAAFALLSFVLHYGLERRFDRLHLFDQYNVLFQADPNERLEAMSNGWGSSGRNIAHPNLANFTGPVVRGIAFVAPASIAHDEEAQRRSIGLLITPFAAAVTSAALFALFLRFGLSLRLASLLTLLGVVSFSPVIFGSIPDHFALSVSVIVAAYHLFLTEARECAVRWGAWFAAMFVAAGVTITNLAIIAILMLGSMWDQGRGRVRSMLQVAGLVVAVAVLTFASSLAFSHVIRASSLDARQSTKWARAFINRDVAVRLARFPVALANTIAPAEIRIGGPTESYRPDDRYQFRFTFEGAPGRPTARSLPGLIALAAMAVGAGVSVRRRGTLASLGLASTAIVGFNWVLHGAWGDEPFLYSQHWFVSVLALMAIAVAAARSRPRLATGLVAIFVLVVAVNSARLLGAMLAILRLNSV